MIWLIAVVPMALLALSLGVIQFIRGLCKKRDFGPKTFDNLLQSMIMFSSAAGLNIAFSAYVVTHKDDQLDMNLAIAILVFCVALWATGVNAYRVGYKTQMEWGA